MGFTSFDDFMNKKTSGKGRMIPFQKVSLAAGGVAGVWFSAWTWSGWPPAGTYPGTALEAVAIDDTTVGSIYHGGNVSPDTKHLLWWSAQSAAATAVPGKLMLVDQLLYYPGIPANSTANQALTNSVALPRYSSGDGVLAFLVVTTAFGTTIGVWTFGTSGYTNSNSEAGRQHGVTVNTVASSVLARIPHSAQVANSWNPFLPMQAGDRGIKSVESVQFTTAHTAGVYALVLCKPLATIPLPAVNVLSERDFMFQIASLERIYDGACLSMLVYEPGALAASTPYDMELGVGWG